MSPVYLRGCWSNGNESEERRRKQRTKQQQTKYEFTVVQNTKMSWVNKLNEPPQSSRATLYGKQLRVASQAATLAGEVILRHWDRERTVSTKTGGAADLVTQVDQEAERVVLEYIRNSFPNDLFIGEEGSSGSPDYELKKGQMISSDPNQGVWCIYPLDGTTNFVHSYPFVTVSIGYCIGGIPRVGVIYNPILGEMYEAEEGQGAFCNKKPISVDESTSLSNCLLVNNIGHSRDKDFVDESAERISKWLNSGLRAFRSSGSAAQNMAHVASGQTSCYYEHGYGGPWDVCAGYVIVKEAGGVIFDAQGTSVEFQLRYGKGSICCGNEMVVKDVTSVAGKPRVVL